MVFSNWLSQFAVSVFRGVSDIEHVTHWSLGTYTPKAKAPVISEEDTPTIQRIRAFKTPFDYFEDLLKRTSYASPDSLVLIAHRL